MRRFLLSIIFVCVLVLPASAHPGRTDSSGGHYDHSTGEYHYHHGYGAHDHYDMDDDGDIDCPYDFEDKTGENSGKSSGSTTRYPAYTRPASTTEESPTKRSSSSDSGDIVLLGILTVSLYGILHRMAKGKPYTGRQNGREVPAALGAFALYATFFVFVLCLLTNQGVSAVIPAAPGAILCVAGLVFGGYYLTWLISGILGMFSIKLGFASPCCYVFLSALWIFLLYLLSGC